MLETVPPASVNPVSMTTSGRRGGTTGAFATRSKISGVRGIPPCYEGRAAGGPARGDGGEPRMGAMPHPEIAITPVRFLAAEADAHILAVPSLDDSGLEQFAALRPALDAIAFTGKKGSFARVYAPEFTDAPLAVVGLGDDADADVVREQVGSAVRQLTGFDTVAVALAGGPEGAWRAAAE